MCNNALWLCNNKPGMDIKYTTREFLTVYIEKEKIGREEFYIFPSKLPEPHKMGNKVTKGGI